MVCIATAADVARLERMPLEQWLPATSMHGVIARAAMHWPDATALSYFEDATRPQDAWQVSYRELLGYVNQAANLFHAAGVVDGESVALIAPNMPEAHFAMWGGETVARVCPLNILLDTAHVAELLRAARARVLVVLGPDPVLPIWQRVEPLMRALDLRAVFAIGDLPVGVPGVTPFMSALAEHDGEALAFARKLDADTPAALFHTGGTTGLPKLAQHLHGNQVHTSASAALYYDLGPHDVLLNGFPLFHVAGSLVYGSSCFVAGSHQVLPTRAAMRNPEVISRFWKLVRHFGVSAISGVPTTLATLLDVTPAPREMDSVRVFLTGGSPLPGELAAAVERRFERPVRNIFGMTESAGLVAVEPFHGPRIAGSAGLPLPYTTVRAFQLRDATVDLGAPCEVDETGVLALRGPNVGPGYTDASRNAGTFECGWLISGDLGHVDADGRVHITGRSKDVIIRGAHNIDPAVIEEVVAAHPAVALCAAVGQADSYAGEIPVCYVTLNAGADASAAELATFAGPQIPEPPARPKRIEVIDEMPVTAIGKIYKPELRRRAAEYAFREALGAALGNLADVQVCARDEAGRTRVAVRVPGVAMLAPARAALRDFALQWSVEAD